ncbi:MAG: hypothetical protein J2P25_02870 [Nocardiopsaceae bacterium]|nr:hypothetical protein [Nocardiopsaceae bacterium]
MIRAHSALASAFVLLAASASATGLAGTSSAAASMRSLCHTASAKVDGGSYVVENDEYASSASECLRVGDSTAFSVSRSAIANPTDGTPGAYPSAYTGCHWGSCSSGGLAAHPLPVSALSPGTVTTDWSTAQPYHQREAYDVAYDIWVNRTPRTSGASNGSEIMIWLNHRGPVQPAGREVARNVKIGIRHYDVWSTGSSTASHGNTISYTLTSPHASVEGLDIGKVIGDAVARGYTSPSWYLISVEAGFELWRGGAGLASKSLAVHVK